MNRKTGGEVLARTDAIYEEARGVVQSYGAKGNIRVAQACLHLGDLVRRALVSDAFPRDDYAARAIFDALVRLHAKLKGGR